MDVLTIAILLLIPMFFLGLTGALFGYVGGRSKGRHESQMIVRTSATTGVSLFGLGGLLVVLANHAETLPLTWGAGTLLCGVASGACGPAYTSSRPLLFSAGALAFVVVTLTAGSILALHMLLSNVYG